eukprot:scaffold115_cov241-Pinguiococcus_pyrenoidosus.AAC.21
MKQQRVMEQLQTLEALEETMREARSSPQAWDSRSLSRRQETVENDESFRIDGTDLGDWTECENSCGSLVPLRLLRQHLQSECSARIVACPTPGCKAHCAAGLLSTHLGRASPPNFCSLAAGVEIPLCQPIQRTFLLAQKSKAPANPKMPIPCPNRCAQGTVPCNTLQAHLRHFCPRRLVSCNVPSCGVVVEFEKLAQHQRSRLCRAFWRRRRVEEEAERRREPIPCELCGQLVPQLQLSSHVEHDCPMRIVRCPNFGPRCGCGALLAKDLEEHLSQHCEAVEFRKAAKEAGTLRRRLQQCPQCGVQVESGRLARHLHTECEGRLVRCKNWEFGCGAIVRLRDMRVHCDVSGIMRARPALEMLGGDSQVVIREASSSGPCTVEFWVYRPLCNRQAALHTRTALQKLWDWKLYSVGNDYLHRRVPKILRGWTACTKRTQA